MSTEKGTTAHDAVVTFITRNGFASSTLQCDGEPALVKLLEEIGKQTSLPLDRSPATSSQHEAWQKSLCAHHTKLYTKSIAHGGEPYRSRDYKTRICLNFHFFPRLAVYHSPAIFPGRMSALNFSNGPDQSLFFSSAVCVACCDHFS